MSYKLIILFIILFIILLILSLIVYRNRLQIKLWLLNRLIVMRGILAPNCGWFNISDLLIGDDSSGINLYNKTYEQKWRFFRNKYV